jgi:hypothetical protein
MDSRKLAEYTPGPWTRRAIPGHLFELHTEDGTPVMRIRGGMMPTLADGNLLAAAPELLAALVDAEAVGTGDYEHRFGKDEFAPAWVLRARAAIAAARGVKP